MIIHGIIFAAPNINLLNFLLSSVCLCVFVSVRLYAIIIIITSLQTT